MSMHKIQSELERANMTSTVNAFKTPEGMCFGAGKTVGNGKTDIWAPGAIFVHTDGSSFALVYTNVGTKASASWGLVVGGSAQAFINLPLGAWTEQDGTALADFVAGASTTPGWSAGDEGFGIRWNNHANPDPISTSVPIPPDLDASSDVVVHILAAKVGATLADAVTWTIEAFNNVDGAAYDADTDFGGTSSAMTGDATTKTCQEETLTLAAANVAASPCVLTLTLQPTDGTLGTDDVILLGVWLEYTKAFLTS